MKSRLFSQDDEVSHAYDNAVALLPGVLEKLHSNNYLEDFMSLLGLIASNKFPMKNIALILLLEVARWFSLSSTRLMRINDIYRS